jgi:hypothetical protein
MKHNVCRVFSRTAIRTAIRSWQGPVIDNESQLRKRFTAKDVISNFTSWIFRLYAATFQNHLHMQYISIQLIRYSKTCGSYPQLKAADTNNDETKQGLL